ncbi:hypothetical protein FRC00_008507, partial [Tulasnella sp. 408]
MYERSHPDTVLAVQTMQRSLDVPSLALDSARQRAAEIAEHATNTPGRLFKQLVRHNDQAPPDEIRSATRAAKASNHGEAATHLLRDGSSAPTVLDVVKVADEA